MELEKRVKDWEYWCPKCKNRTSGVIVETPSPILQGSEAADERYLTVRVLTCGRCSAPTVLGTFTYYNDEKGWAARGNISQVGWWTPPVRGPQTKPVTTSSGRPLEYVAFQEPVSERELPVTIPKKVKESFREAEFAVAHYKPIGAASCIRNAIRLLVEHEGIKTAELKAAITELDMPDGYRRALGNLKLVGDHTLHFEEYKIPELANALEVLHLALSETYHSREQLAALESAVGSKASQQGKAKQSEQA